MSLSDPIADMLTCIRNGQQVRLAHVHCPSSKFRKSILDVLKKDGFITGYEEITVRKGVNKLNIELSYYQGQPVIKEIKRISKPGLRTYSTIADLHRIRNGLGISILSTSKGIMSDNQARLENVGGEILCSVF